MGDFGTGMGYARFGTGGSKSLLWIPDPSHTGHRGPYLRMMTRAVRPFVEAGYTVYLVGHTPHLATGASLADTAEDYATLIGDELGGKVDLVVGDSGGGQIGFCLAAAHPELFGDIVIVAAGHTLSPQAKAATVESARLLAAGRRTDAAAAMVALLYPDLHPPWLAHLVAAVIGRVSFPTVYDPSDVVATAEALAAFDGRQVVTGITVPVLLIGGDRDRYVPAEVYRETADLIPDSTFRLYQGKDHLGTIFDPRLSGDVLDFVDRRHQRPV